MDTLHQQVDLPVVAQGVDELLLDRVEVVEGQFLGRLGGRPQDLALGGAAIEAIETGRMDGLADRLAPGATEGPLLTPNDGPRPRTQGPRAGRNGSSGGVPGAGLGTGFRIDAGTAALTEARITQDRDRSGAGDVDASARW